MSDEQTATDFEEWEARCLGCGRCCYEKVEFEGRIYYTAIPCEKLDLETGRCTVYAERTRQRPGCVQLTPDIVRRGILPADCPYVADAEDYRPPVLFDEEDGCPTR